MKQLILNLVLALIWCMLTGSANPWNFLAGVLVGAIVVDAFGAVRGDPSYFARIGRLIGFACYFVWILIKANLEIAHEILTPRPRSTPRILRYSVEGLTDAQKTALSSAITLTPGTLVVDISPCGEWFYVHAMFAHSRERTIADLDELKGRLTKGVFS